MKQQILRRWTGAVLFECEIPADVESGLAMRHALERATASGAVLRDAVLRDAVLSGADLSGAVLRDAVLRDAVLRGAVLRDAVLRDAVLRGADGNPLPRAESAEAIENLDKVRAIILDNKARLEMNHWHGDSDWKDRTCAEETICGTTHCLAGWLQVCSTKQELRALDPNLAGILAAPVASKMFYRTRREVLPWLKERKYVAEIADDEARKSARDAARSA